MSFIFLTTCFLCFRCTAATINTAVQDFSEPSSWKSSIKLSAKPLWVKFYHLFIRWQRSRGPTTSIKTTLPLSQMLYIPTVWLSYSVCTPAEQPHTQPLHPPESCRLHSVQSTQLLSSDSTRWVQRFIKRKATCV